MQYLVSITDKKISRKPEEYVFNNEEEIQEIMANNPEIILNIPEIEVEGKLDAMSCREFPTGNGSIDVLYITSIGEIIFVETKLIKNAEATRTVVAQVIDYIKGLSSFRCDDFLHKVDEKKQFRLNQNRDEKSRHQISEALRTGYFKAVILGDFINPNILGMVESIQAAPHLAFSIFLVEANARKLDGEIAISPKVVSNTVQIERSVIRLEINLPPEQLEQVKITSEIPMKDREGNKPKKSWDEFIQSVVPTESALKIDKFKNDWEEDFPNTISMGVVGFSAGVILGKTRIPIQYVYNNRLAIISKAQRDTYNIQESIYDEYKEELKAVPKVYDEYVVGGKVEVPFSKLTVDEIEIILLAAKNLAKKLSEQK